MQSKINILQMIGTFLVGGAEKVVVNLCNNLDPLQVKLTLTARVDGPLSKEILAPHRLEIIPKRNGFDLLHLLKLVQIIKRQNINVIHSHMFGPNLFGLLAGKLSNRKVVGTIHGRDCFLTRSRINFYRFFGAYFDQLVTVSPLLEEELLGYAGRKGLKIRTIMNGVPFRKSEVRMNRDAIAKNLNLPDGKTIVGSVGNVRPIKGQDVMLRALKYAEKKGFRNLVYLIVGDVFDKYRGYREELEGIAASLGLKEKVIYLGFRQDIAEILKLIDVYVLPSRSEGVSLSLLEAMGTGLPVIVTDVGMNARIVDNEISGLVVPPENFDAMGAALVRLLENRSLAETMAAKAFEAVRTHFSVEVMSREYESLFFALAGRQRDADPIIG